MKFSHLFSLLAMSFSGLACAASFELNGTTVTSRVTEKAIECDNFKVVLKSEEFPFKYEEKIPAQFRIKGFYGPDTVLNKEAILMPGEVAISNPNSIKELQALYPKDRTYLPTSAVCKGNVLIMSYWSGGNCSECEAYIKFEISNGIPANPSRAIYREFKALEQGT